MDSLIDKITRSFFSTTVWFYRMKTVNFSSEELPPLRRQILSLTSPDGHLPPGKKSPQLIGIIYPFEPQCRHNAGEKGNRTALEYHLGEREMRNTKLSLP